MGDEIVSQIGDEITLPTNELPALLREALREAFRSPVVQLYSEIRSGGRRAITDEETLVLISNAMATSLVERYVSSKK